jgi:dihydrofolate reductase
MKLPFSLVGIVAMTGNRVIGRDGTLPWHLPDDLAFFKKTTSGHPIVMGRKTFDSIGRPLPKRQNIILTRDKSWQHEGVDVIHDPDGLPDLIRMQGDVFIIGGAEIYQAFLPLLDALLITHVHHDYPGDTHFPEYERMFPQEEVIVEHELFTVKRHARCESMS